MKRKPGKGDDIATVAGNLYDHTVLTSWQEVMPQDIIAKMGRSADADAFSVFKKNGIFDQKTTQSFRDNVISKGGTEHPMVLYNGSVDKSQPSMHCWNVTKSRYNIKIRGWQTNFPNKPSSTFAICEWHVYGLKQLLQTPTGRCTGCKDKMIISDGYNGTPSGFENVCEDNNVTKPYVLHAEANAITKLAHQQQQQ